jgi:hypothetical protein
MKIDITQTHIGSSTNIKTHAHNARSFLIDNINLITFNHDEETRLLNIKDSLMHTINSDLFRQTRDEQKLGIFKPLLLDKVDKIPSWFLISWLDIDTLTLRNFDKTTADVLNTLSDYRDKIILDITPYYSSKRGMITETTLFYGRIVRNLLCRSYHTSGNIWLKPSLLVMLAKFYSLILSSKIGKVYNLTYQEQFVATTALSVFFMNRCTENHDVISPLLGKLDYLRRVIDTKPIYEYIADKYTPETYTLDAVADVIVEFGPSRIAQFTAQTLIQMNMNLTSNNLISIIALEYPPYWCHVLLSAMSGDKSSLYHSIKTLNLKQDEHIFQQELLKTSSFIRSL